MKAGLHLLPLLVLPLTACGDKAASAPPESAVNGATSAESGAPATPAAPVDGPVRSAAQAQAADGQSVELEGVYRKRMSLKGMPRPGREKEYVFLGYVEIELEGEERAFRVQLGTAPRPDEEVAAFADKKVKVTGALQLTPASQGSGPSQRPKPTLMEPGPVSVAE